jgi:hypothetical protein
MGRLPRSTAIGLVAVAVLLLGIVWSPRAEACSFAGPQPFSLNASNGDVTPPAPPVLDHLQIRRSDHAPPGNGDCGEIGSIQLTLGLSDDTFAADQIGVRLRLKDGSLPPGLALPPDPIVHDSGMVLLAFPDDPDQRYSFTLAVSAIDGARNESEPTDVVVTGEPQGCACTLYARGTPGTGHSLAAVAALIALARRRR